MSDINIKCKLINCGNESIHNETNMFLMLPLKSTLNESYRDYKSTVRLNEGWKYGNICSTICNASSFNFVKIFNSNPIL